jgi:hypothetical protein
MTVIGPYAGQCDNCECSIPGLVFEDYDEDGFTECADGWDDGIRILIDDEGGTFSYAPVTDPAIAELEQRLAQS